MKLFHGKCAACLAIVAGSLVSSSNLQATNILWDGTGTSWTNVASWSLITNGTTPNPAAKPGAADFAIFNITTVNTAQTVNLDAAQAALGLSFNSTGAVLIQTGVGTNTLTLGTGGIDVAAGAGTDTITAGIVLAGSQTWTNNSSNTLFINGGIANGANTLTIAGSGNTIFNGALGTGAGGLNKNGAGTLSLLNSNTFTGGLNILGGTVVVSNPGALNSTTPNAVSFGPNSAGTLTLNGTSVTISSLTTDATVGTPFVQNGSGTIATLTVNNAGNGTFAGVLRDGTSSNSLALTKNNFGTLTLSGANQYTGLTTIQAGTLRLGSATALGSTAGSTTIGNGGTLDLNGQTIGGEGITILDSSSLFNSSASDASLSGTFTAGGMGSTGNVTVNGVGNITLSGAVNPNSGLYLTKQGANTLTLAGSVDNYSLGLIASNGLVRLAKASTPGDHAVGTSLVVNGGTVQLTGTGGDQIFDAAPVTVASGTLDMNDRTEQIYSLSLEGGGIGDVGALVNTGTGEGVLNVSPSGSSGAITLTGPTGIGTTQSSASLRVNGRITGSSYLVEYGPGTLILNGNSDFTGGTYVNVGTLAVGHNNALGTGPLTMYAGNLRSDTSPHTISNAVVMLGDITVNGSLDLTLAGTVSGSHILNKTGTGTLVVSGDNTFTGGLHVHSGTLAVGGNNALSTVTVTLDGGAIRSEGTPRTIYNAIDVAFASSVTGSTDLTLAGPISGNAGLTKLGTGTLALTGTNTFAGGINVVAGSLALNAGSLPSNITTHSAFVYNGGTLSGQLNNQGTATFNADFNAAGGLSNTGNVIMSPGISLTLSGSGMNNQGSLALAGGVISGGPLVNSSILSGNGTLGMTGGLTNNGQLTVSGGTLILASPGASSNAGSVDIASGLQLQLTIGTLANTGTIDLNGGTLSGAGTLNNTTGVVGGHGTISTAITNSGGIVVDGGILNITTAVANSGEIMLAGALSTLGGAGTITNTGLIRGDGVMTKAVTNNIGGEIRAENGKRIKLQGAVVPSNGKINLQGGTAEFSPSLTNGTNGQIEGRGTLITGGAGLINTGHIALSSGVTDVFGDLNNATGIATKGITISGNADVTFWDDVTNAAGSLFKLSSGSSVTVFGTYSGAGISGNANDIHLEADVSPGFSPATVDFGGNLHFSSTTRLKIELGGTTAGTEYDQVRVSEQLSLDGTLDVDLIDLGSGQFAPTAGDSFNILDWGTLAGTFSAFDLPALGSGLTWNTSQLYSTGVLSVVSAGLPGDYNNNGTVDTGDYVLWRKHNNTAVTLPNDATPGTSPADYTVWRSHFGQPLGSGSGAIEDAAVPEPATMVLLIMAAACFRVLRRRTA